MKNPENSLNLPPNPEPRAYEQIGPTAWTVAYQRSLADIKYAPEIFVALQPLIESASPKERTYFEQASVAASAAQLEARFKLVNRILAEYQPTEILELAAGLSPRGLALTLADRQLKYVEVDLPDMAREKNKIIATLSQQLGLSPDNLQIRAGDALGQKSLWAATKDFQPGQLAVINEGLLRYLNFTQKAQVAQNVHALLEHFGGIWITPDITTRKTIVSTSKGAEYQRIQDLAGIDIDANSFRDEQQARDFFTQQGFRVTSRSYAEVAAGLVAPARAGLSPAEAQATLDTSPPVFVMSLI